MLNFTISLIFFEKNKTNINITRLVRGEVSNSLLFSDINKKNLALKNKKRPLNIPYKIPTNNTPKPQFLFGDTNNLQFKSDLHHHELLQSRPASSRCSSSSRFDRSSPISLLPFLYSIEFSLSFKIWFHCNSPMSL